MATTQEQFIEKISPYIIKYAPKYGIKVYSPVIAQACLESAYGTSAKAGRHNYFGLKYRENRISCHNGSFEAGGSAWYSFADMEHGVEGYFQFINTANYACLKKITDPRKYLDAIKACGYASGVNYADNVYSVIQKYQLTKYDENRNMQEAPASQRENRLTPANKLTINISAGHNPDGKIACGAVGLLKESTEARNVKDKVISLLLSQGHTVYDCTVDNGISQSDVLKKIVTKCNAHSVDLDISIHFNAGANKLANNATTGTEVYVYSAASKAKDTAQRIVNNISGLGFRNRGVKYSNTLYFLKKTKNPAILVECCFVDDPDDAALYRTDKMAQAIVEGITGKV